jgi:hypothetical protein
MNMMTDVKPAVVNGIDTDAVMKLVGEVAVDPANGMTNWRVATRWQGQTHSRTTVED